MSVADAPGRTLAVAWFQTRASSARELMFSLRKTFFKWKVTSLTLGTAAGAEMDCDPRSSLSLLTVGSSTCRIAATVLR